MSQLLRIAAYSALGYLLLGGRVIGAVMDRFTYELGKPRLSDIGLDWRNGEAFALLKMRLYLKQSTGLDLSVMSVSLNFSQGGNPLGSVRTNQSSILPNNETVEVPLKLDIPQGKFFAHLQSLAEPQTNRFALDPIKATGSVTLSNGISFPVFFTMNFFSFG